MGSDCFAKAQCERDNSETSDPVSICKFTLRGVPNDLPDSVPSSLCRIVLKFSTVLVCLGSSGDWFEALFPRCFHKID